MAVLQHTSSDLLLWNVLVLLKKNLKLTRKSRLLFKLRVVHNIENRWKGRVFKERAYPSLECPPWKKGFSGWGRGVGCEDEGDGYLRLCSNSENFNTWNMMVQFAILYHTLFVSVKRRFMSVVPSCGVPSQASNVRVERCVHALCTYQYR